MNSDISDVRLSRLDGVALVELRRPDSLNALSTRLATALTSTLHELRDDDTVHAVVLAGAGDRAFCVGADLKERNTLDDDGFRAQRVVFRAAFASVRALPQPAVAGVHGFAVGGGLDLALSFALLVAYDTSVIGLPEVSLGLVPG